MELIGLFGIFGIILFMILYLCDAFIFDLKTFLLLLILLFSQLCWIPRIYFENQETKNIIKSNQLIIDNNIIDFDKIYEIEKITNHIPYTAKYNIKYKISEYRK